MEHLWWLLLKSERSFKIDIKSTFHLLTGNLFLKVYPDIYKKQKPNTRNFVGQGYTISVLATPMECDIRRAAWDIW